MEKQTPQSVIDVSLDAASLCSNNRVNSCCRKAFEIGVKELGFETVAAAMLKVSCDGPNESGCQARITGHFLNSDGIPIAEVSTTAHELRELQD